MEYDDFVAFIDDPEAYGAAITAMEAIGVAYGDAGVPMRAPEDSGGCGSNANAAILCLGPGEDYAALRNPDDDFPDELIPI